MSVVLYLLGDIMEDKKLSIAQNALYNTIGSIVFCFCQWIISALLVVHLSPEESSVGNAGLLQLAITTTNIFFAISCYNMRTYQISDTTNRYSNGEYIGTRIVTSVIAVVLCLGYTVMLGYPVKTVFCIMLYMLFKLSETYSDVLHAVDQKYYRMDYVCVSYCLRGASSVVVFAVALLLSGDVLITILVLSVINLAEVWFYDVKKTRLLGPIKPVFNKKVIGTLLITCLPAVVSSAAFTAVTTVPRQTLATMYGEEALGYYGTIATPLVIVQILATSIFNPMLTQLSEYYNDGAIKKFLTRLFNNLLLLAGISVAVYAGVALLGEFAVGLVFGSKFASYTYLMYGIVACTSMYVVSWLCTNTLIIMRSLKSCAVASLSALAVSLLLSKTLINLFQMNGVSVTVIVAYIIHISVCSSVIYKNLKIKGKNK